MSLRIPQVGFISQANLASARFVAQAALNNGHVSPLLVCWFLLIFLRQFMRALNTPFHLHRYHICLRRSAKWIVDNLCMPARVREVARRHYDR